MRKVDLIVYPLAALMTAAYWIAVAWLCFALTGHDPIDLASATLGGGMRAALLALVAGFALLFAILDRLRYSRRARKDKEMAGGR